MLAVSGPAVNNGGATMWSLTTAAGTDPGVYPNSATWWVGPIASNPYVTRINAAKITSTAYSYGIANSTIGYGSPWNAGTTGTLIGVAQTGNILTIASFSYDGAQDQNTPYAILTFTLQQ